MLLELDSKAIGKLSLDHCAPDPGHGFKYFLSSLQIKREEVSL